MNEKIAEKTIEIIEEGFNQNIDFSNLISVGIPDYDKIYFGEILKKINEEDILINPKLGFEKTTKGILINIGLHSTFHEFLPKTFQGDLEDEFLKLVKIYEIKNLKDKTTVNFDEILEKISYGFFSLIYLGSKTNNKRAMVDRAILSNLYYDSIINKTWWGYEIDVNKFYEKLEELEKMSEKKIKNMIEKMGYFTLP
jgi:hypothetical protein